MNRTFSLEGSREMSDKVRYESIKVLNQALMERLGEATAELNKVKAENAELERTIEIIREVMEKETDQWAEIVVRQTNQSILRKAKLDRVVEEWYQTDEPQDGSQLEELNGPIRVPEVP
jgi:hypothetical protein